MTPEQSSDASRALALVVRLLDHARGQDDAPPFVPDLFIGSSGRVAVTFNASSPVPLLSRWAQDDRQQVVEEALPPLDRAKQLALTVLLGPPGDQAAANALADFMMDSGIAYVEELKKKAVAEHLAHNARERLRRQNEESRRYVRHFSEEAARDVSNWRHLVQGPSVEVTLPGYSAEDAAATRRMRAQINELQATASLRASAEAVQARLLGQTGMTAEQLYGRPGAPTTAQPLTQEQVMAQLRPMFRPLESVPLIGVDFASFEAREDTARETLLRSLGVPAREFQAQYQNEWPPAPPAPPHMPPLTPEDQRFIDRVQQALGTGPVAVEPGTFTPEIVRQASDYPRTLSQPVRLVSVKPPDGLTETLRRIQNTPPLSSVIAPEALQRVLIEDSREGWADAVRRVLSDNADPQVLVDADHIRGVRDDRITDNEPEQNVQFFAYESIGMAGVESRVLDSDDFPPSPTPDPPTQEEP